ncbi:Na(+) H(+) antiporter subunit E [Fulvivirga imtechensis AK7]|uniref:Na(+) H(+) antiporter subunit E n=1 Tax=Fulvivirga imtechensis AK7 TaxID=1237149 RepID=L8JNC2_9BACT|nr:Na+/H+ antiporter subunit E [Fulvivirga imtechensis]ELR70446.1 Na(+) H(+) antiporter subunit E [Fulvivirga imtechensis AK7]
MRAVSKIWFVIEMVFFFFKRFISSNIEVAHEVLTPTFYMEPAVIEVPIEVKTDHEILLLANLISMTPGTLSLDISDNKEKLYIHAMYVDNVKDFLKEIKQLEQRIDKIFD